MAIKLNKAAYDHADEEVRYLNTHGLEKYGTWFLGIDEDADPKDKSKFVYAFGDFSVLHKSALLDAIKQAGRDGDQEIKKAAEQLLAMIK